MAGVDVNGWPACLLHEGDDLESLAHEFGHAFGLEHAWGLSSDGKGLAPYRSPYCVMASQAYGGRRPSFAAPAEPQGPPAGDGFWTRFPPMPAAATLYNQVPDFAALPHVVQAGQVEPLWSRTVRLHARDRSVGPVLAVARAGSGTLGGRQAYLVELRRGQGYDRRIGAGSGAPSAGLVVHSLKDIDEYQDAPEHDRKVVYEGTLGLPVASGDVDWRSKDGDFALRVGDVAPDLSWADVTLGGAALARDAAVALTGETAGGSSELIEEGIAENVSVFVCSKGSYRFTIDRQDAVVRCTEMAAGYDSPRYTWTVNGVPAKESTFPVTSLSIVVPVIATFPRPTSKTIEERDAKMRFESDDNILTLYGDGADGNYDIKVEVTAHESATALNPVPPSSASTTISMSGQIVTFEQRYYDDVDACVDRFRDLNDKFAKSKSWPGFDPRRNPLHKLDMIQRMSVDLADRDPVAAGQLATVAANYAQKVRR